MPLDGWHAAAVPGAPHAYATLNREFGTLPLADLLAPALAYAERRHRRLRGHEPDHRRAQPASWGSLPTARRCTSPTDRHRAPATAGCCPIWRGTIRAYATGGPEAFYRGAVAAEIVRASTAGGGLCSG